MNSNFLLLVVVLLSTTATVFSQEVPELIKLREGYKAAMDRASKPITQTYVTELAKLRDALSRSAKVDAAKAVQDEINLIGAESNVKPVGEAPNSKPTAGGVKLPDVRWFVGRTWATDRGTKYQFSKDGQTGSKFKGDQKVANFTWAIVPETGNVQLAETPIGATASGAGYFRFVSRTEAYAGGTPDNMAAKLHPE